LEVGERIIGRGWLTCSDITPRCGRKSSSSGQIRLIHYSIRKIIIMVLQIRLPDNLGHHSNSKTNHMKRTKYSDHDHP
jgi:hypothetical protein